MVLRLVLPSPASWADRCKSKRAPEGGAPRPFPRPRPRPDIYKYILNGILLDNECDYPMDGYDVCRFGDVVVGFDGWLRVDSIFCGPLSRIALSLSFILELATNHMLDGSMFVWFNGSDIQQYLNF